MCQYINKRIKDPLSLDTNSTQILWKKQEKNFFDLQWTINVLNPITDGGGG